MPDKIGDNVERQIPTKNAPPYTFLFLSNMIETKGVYILLEACAFLKRRGYDFRCNFVGQWFDVTQEDFDAKCAHLGVSDCVQAYGAKYGAEKDSFLLNTDALVFPTYYPSETFGLVILEAMQFSLPVISTNEAAIPDIIETGTTGWIVEKQNPLALAEKMEWMLTHPQESIQMGKSGRARFEQYYTLEHFEMRMLKLLNDCFGDNLDNQKFQHHNSYGHK